MSVNVPSAIPANVASFVRNFYAISDDESKHDEYVQSFIANGPYFQIGPMKAANDHAGILAWRKEKWEPVAKRTHTIHDVFPHPDKPNEYMLHGAVDYNLKNGSTGSASWGGWMVFDDSAAADLKLKKYTVWLTPQ